MICLMIAGSDGTTLSDVMNLKDDDTCHPEDISQCTELDSHSGETSCEVFVNKGHFGHAVNKLEVDLPVTQEMSSQWLTSFFCHRLRLHPKVPAKHELSCCMFVPKRTIFMYYSNSGNIH